MSEPTIRGRWCEVHVMLEYRAGDGCLGQVDESSEPCRWADLITLADAEAMVAVERERVGGAAYDIAMAMFPIHKANAFDKALADRMRQPPAEGRGEGENAEG